MAKANWHIHKMVNGHYCPERELFIKESSIHFFRELDSYFILGSLLRWMLIHPSIAYLYACTQQFLIDIDRQFLVSSILNTGIFMDITLKGYYALLLRWLFYSIVEQPCKVIKDVEHKLFKIGLLPHVDFNDSMGMALFWNKMDLAEELLVDMLQVRILLYIWYFMFIWMLSRQCNNIYPY